MAEIVLPIRFSTADEASLANSNIKYFKNEADEILKNKYYNTMSSSFVRQLNDILPSYQSNFLANKTNAYYKPYKLFNYMRYSGKIYYSKNVELPYVWGIKASLKGSLVYYAIDDIQVALNPSSFDNLASNTELLKPPIFLFHKQQPDDINTYVNSNPARTMGLLFSDSNIGESVSNVIRPFVYNDYETIRLSYSTVLSEYTREQLYLDNYYMTEQMNIFKNGKKQYYPFQCYNNNDDGNYSNLIGRQINDLFPLVELECDLSCTYPDPDNSDTYIPIDLPITVPYLVPLYYINHPAVGQNYFGYNEACTFLYVDYRTTKSMDMSLGLPHNELLPTILGLRNLRNFQGSSRSGVFGSYGGNVGQVIYCFTADEWKRIFTTWGIYGTWDTFEATSMNTADWVIGGGGEEPVGPTPPEPPKPPEPPTIKDNPGSGGFDGGQTGGGIGNNDTSSDEIPSTTNKTPGSLFISTHLFDETNLGRLVGALNDYSLWNEGQDSTVGSRFSNLISSFVINETSGVVNVLLLPFNVRDTTAFPYTTLVHRSPVNILGVDMARNIPSQGVLNVEADQITQWQGRVTVGTYKFNEFFGSFLDYEPYTKIHLYLPFVGFTDLSADMVMNKVLQVDYSISKEDGSCSAILLLNGVVVKTLNGQMGYSIPFSTTNLADLKTDMMISTVSAVAKTSDSGNPSNLLSTLNTAIGMKGKAGGTVSGTFTPQHALYLPTCPYIIFERPITNMPKGYGSIYGYPTNLYTQLSNVQGYTVCENVKLDGVGFGQATPAELTEIKSILESGVIL